MIREGKTLGDWRTIPCHLHAGLCKRPQQL